MKQRWMVAIISLLLIWTVYCPAAEAASLKTISSATEFRDESRYIIYSGNTQTAMFDDGGNTEGWIKKGAYNANAQLHNLCKFWWEITAGEEGYYLVNVGTGFPIKGQGTTVSQRPHVVSDKNDGSAKGLYVFETAEGGFKIKSKTNNQYMVYGQNQDYITLTDDVNAATTWKIDEVHSRLEGSQYIWKTQTAGNYYRIPAIAATNNGDLIVSVDKRYANNADLGNGKRIDVLTKKSTNDGDTWSAEEVNLTENSGAANFGFGDPAIVADRDSDKVLILCATGSSGYGGSTRENIQGVSSILSENNGETFSEPVDLTEEIYSLKKEWQGLFVASGRIMQSRYIKVGDYYRLYCSVLTRVSPGFSSNAIYILYSDDFGSNWNILGGGEQSPVVAGDEAKLEELSDGSVVVSSRKTDSSADGRFINIYHYDQNDPTFTAGSWGEKESVIIGQNTQGTNGEILVVYAKDKQSGEYKFLTLHSIPTVGTGRNGVGIYFKEMGAQDSQVSGFVNGWSYDDFYMVQNGPSGYSTMTVKKDGEIGFFYEDSMTWYDLVYLNLDLATITKDRYEMAFPSGIGSAETPYQVTTEEQARAVLEVYQNEGVHWSFSGEALTYIQSAVYPDLAEKIAQAQEVYDSQEVDSSYQAAVKLNTAIETASALTEGSDGNQMMAAVKALDEAVVNYQYMAYLQEQLTAKVQEAETLLSTNRIEAERMEAVALQTVLNQAKGDNSQTTYGEFVLMLEELEEKIELYAQTFSVEARYSSNHIRFLALNGIAEYKILKSEEEKGSYEEVTTITAEDDKIEYSYIDEDAGTDTQLWYKIEAVKEGEGEAVVLGPLKDQYATGIEAVQKHAQAEQLHYDFITGGIQGEDAANPTYFDGNRIVEGTQEELDRVKNLTEGSVIISYKPDVATGRKGLLILKRIGANVPSSGNMSDGQGFIFVQQDGDLRWDSSKGGLRGGFSGTAPAQAWSTFGVSNHTFTVEGKNNVLNSWNGSSKDGWSSVNWNGFMTRATNLGILTIGGDKATTGNALTYTGHIAYVTITDEIFSEQELNDYTAAVTDSIMAPENPTPDNPIPELPAMPQGFEAEAGDRQVSFRWNAVEGTVDGYQLSQDNGENWTELITETQYILTGLENGKEYTFMLRAVNSAGNSETASVVATPQAEQVEQPEQVEAPVISPEGKEYDTVQTISISCATEDAVIYYTTNGEQPTEESKVYQGPFEVAESQTIQAIAIKDGVSSTITTASYVIRLPQPVETVVTPVFSVKAGTYTQIQNVVITSETEGATIYYTTDGKVPTIESTKYSKAITVDKSMTLKAIAVKEGMENSEVSEAVYVINLPDSPDSVKETVKIPTFSVSAGTYTKAQSVTISCATQGATIYYTTDGKTPTVNSTKYSKAITVDKSMTLKAIAVKEGMENSEVSEAVYVINLPDSPDSVKETVKIPTFSVSAGTYTKAQSVTISCATQGATIYYTTDGKTPTVNSTKYSKAITVDKSMTLKAIAIKAGMDNSAVATAAYTIKVEVKEKEWIFTDVPVIIGNWKYESVKYVYNKDVMGAITGTKEFQPDRPLSRSMFATVLYRMAGSPEVAYKAQFSDVPAGKWYSSAIIWAYENKIVSGLGDGSFGINQNITREQIAKMLYEYANVCKYDVSATKDLNSFTDVKEVSGWAVKYMQWATAVEMITGKPNDEAKTSFRMDPKGEATRAECAAMLTRFDNRYQP